jgi:DNA-binding beta-propeller fold protein YncE
VPVGSAPKGIVVAGGSVWVCISSAAIVQRIDPARARKSGQVRTGDTPTGIDVGGGSLWVSNRLGGTVTQIDISGDRPAITGTIDPQLTNPFAIAARGSDVWVTDPSTGEVAHLTGG